MCPKWYSIESLFSRSNLCGNIFMLTEIAKAILSRQYWFMYIGFRLVPETMYGAMNEYQNVYIINEVPYTLIQIVTKSKWVIFQRRAFQKISVTKLIYQVKIGPFSFLTWYFNLVVLFFTIFTIKTL